MTMVEQAFEAQALNEKELLSKQNVIGVAIGYKDDEDKGQRDGELAVVVLVDQKRPLAALSPEDIIPPELQGMKTDVYEVGELRALGLPPIPAGPPLPGSDEFTASAGGASRQRYRPTIPNGVSIGHYKVTAGTLAAIVKDRTTGALLLLSNNHVFANSNDAMPGDVILQPATMDGGQNPGDVVAQLERFIRLRFTDEPMTTPTPPTPTPTPGQPAPQNEGCLAVIAQLSNALASILGSQQRLATQAAVPTAAMPSIPAQAQNVPTNICDAALARPINPGMFSDAFQSIGVIDVSKAPSLGMRVRKLGRTTEYTEGAITLLNATVNITYNTSKGQRIARFVDQVLTQGMSDGGDSGALVLDTAENKAVGLLFAGSSLASIFTPIQVVLNELNITLG